MIEFVSARSMFSGALSLLVGGSAADPTTFEGRLSSKILRLIRQGVYDHALFKINRVVVFSVPTLKSTAFFREALEDVPYVYVERRSFPEAAVKVAKLGIVPAEACYSITPIVAHVFDAYSDPEYKKIVVATWGDFPALDCFDRIGKDYSAWIRAKERKAQEELLANKGKLETVYISLDRETEVVKLCDQAALSHEGFVMKHCVGQYSDVLNSKTEFILSLRIKGVSVATAHYKQSTLIQCFGKKNSTVTPEVRSLMASFVPSPAKADTENCGPYIGRFEGMRFIEDEVIAACRGLDFWGDYGRQDRMRRATRELVHPGLQQFLMAKTRFYQAAFVRGAGKTSQRTAYCLRENTLQSATERECVPKKSSGPIIPPDRTLDVYSKAKLFQAAVSYRSFFSPVAALKSVDRVYDLFGRFYRKVPYLSILEMLGTYGADLTPVCPMAHELLDSQSRFNVVTFNSKVESYTFPAEDSSVRQHHVPEGNTPWHVTKGTLNDKLKSDYVPKQVSFQLPGFLGSTQASSAPASDLTKDLVFALEDTYKVFQSPRRPWAFVHCPSDLLY